MRFVPIRSTSVPPKNMPMTMGSTVKKAVMPVCAALCVVWSTNQGTAIAAIALPVTDTKVVPYRVISGRRVVRTGAALSATVVAMNREDFVGILREDDG